jgi:hypothetical protein
VVAEEDELDEVVSEGCPPENEWWQRDNAIVAKIGGRLSLA